METDWDELRKNAISPDRPSEWPADVRAISMQGLSLLGVHDKTRELHWDGEKMVTTKRWSNYERTLATAGLIVGAAASLSAVILTIIEIGRTCCGWK